MELGGLGISQLQHLGWALRIRWLWLQKTEPDKPWAFLPIQVLQTIKCFFDVAVITQIGNGRNTLFWTDRWLQGQSLDKLMPHLFGTVNSRAKKRTVHEAITGRKWISDIRGALTVEVLTEYLGLWDILSDVMLQPELEDTHIWQFSASGIYSAKSAYEALFIGAIQFRPWERIWKSWAPGKCKFFMWLVAHDRCWTADRLARKGLPHHEHCLLCDQEEETINHLLLHCVFSREVWFRVLQGLGGLQAVAPQLTETSLEDWWNTACSRVEGPVKKGLNSVIILVAWSLWIHRNRCVFDGLQPNLSRVLSSIREELHFWGIAGARGVSHLLAQLPAG